MNNLDLVGGLAERVALLLRRGGLSAVAGAFVAPMVLSGPLMIAGILAMTMPVFIFVFVPLAFALPLSAYGAAVAALARAIDREPSVNDAIEETFSRPTLGLFWVVPLLGVVGIEVALVIDIFRGHDLPGAVFGALVMIVPAIAACVAIGRIPLELVVQLSEGPRDGPALRARMSELLGERYLLPLVIFVPPCVVLGVAVAGWWNPIANETLLGFATLGAIFTAALLLAAMPPALYAVLKTAPHPDPPPAPRGEGAVAR
ncbi:MAG TPA: hypothetical protein VFF73_23935 [Planctomycetota bacterium]|nr:hypothetical protein [Planctomycetota bacterium]